MAMRWINKGIQLGIALFLGMSLLGTAAITQAQDDNWVGEYFNNPTLSGSPVLIRADQRIDFVWGAGSPDPRVPADRFSVRWTKAQYFSGGTYRFTARTDDGMRVYLDNTQLSDAWYDRPPDPPLVVELSVTPGTHAMRVEYYENTGAAVAWLNWEQVSGAGAPSLGVATWVAQYFSNPDLAGSPSLEQMERVIDYYWSYNSPAPGLIPPDNFSARWTGSPHFAAGTYLFTIHADDGVRLWVDNQLVIDAWRDSGFTPPYTAVVQLGEGQHAIRVEYYERLEVAGIRVEWSAITVATPTPVPPPTPPPQTGAWQAEYFNNPSLSGPALHTAQIPGLGLDLNWRSGSPAPVIPVDNFSARLTRRVTFGEGPVRFAIRADDGVRLYIDGTLALDEWHVASGTYYFLDRASLAGEHTLTVEYYESGGLAYLRLYWVYPRSATAPTTNVTAQINAFLLNVRSGPSINYPILGRATRNQVFAVTGRSQSDPRWVRINFGTVQGWINGTWATLSGDTAALPVVPAAEEAAPSAFGIPTGLRVRATANLNIRSGPDISYPVIGWLTNGEVADVVGRNSSRTWWEINFTRGRGWVSGAYTQLEGNLSANVPVTG